MKITTYEQFKALTEKELLAIDPDDYTDEENQLRSLWYMRAQQEEAFGKLGSLNDLSKEEVCWLGLDNKHMLNDIISESPNEFTVDGKKIFGREIITYSEFSIVKEDGKNNYYRIFH